MELKNSTDKSVKGNVINVSLDHFLCPQLLGSWGGHIGLGRGPWSVVHYALLTVRL